MGSADERRFEVLRGIFLTGRAEYGKLPSRIPEGEVCLCQQTSGSADQKRREHDSPDMTRPPSPRVTKEKLHGCRPPA